MFEELVECVAILFSKNNSESPWILDRFPQTDYFSDFFVAWREKKSNFKTGWSNQWLLGGLGHGEIPGVPPLSNTPFHDTGIPGLQITQDNQDNQLTISWLVETITAKNIKVDYWTQKYIYIMYTFICTHLYTISPFLSRTYSPITFRYDNHITPKHRDRAERGMFQHLQPTARPKIHLGGSGAVFLRMWSLSGEVWDRNGSWMCFPQSEIHPLHSGKLT